MPPIAIWDEMSCLVFEAHLYETLPLFCHSTRSATTFSALTSKLHTLCSPTEQDSKFRLV